MSEYSRYERAKKRVEELKSFYGHLTSFVFVNIFLLVLNLLTSNNLWFFWVTIGWGIAVAAHAISVFGFPGLTGKAWEDKKIKELMEQMEDEEEAYNGKDTYVD